LKCKQSVTFFFCKCRDADGLVTLETKHSLSMKNHSISTRHAQHVIW